jgi:alanyl-tRNA synthetase
MVVKPLGKSYVLSMTEKLYYRDPYLFEFEARVLRSTPEEKGFSVVLDRTAFYPGGGGQPEDRGTLDGISVTGMSVEGDDITHHVSSSLSPGPVKGKVDAGRRLDFMAQHTGQHILSRAFLEVGNCETVSVHFGEETTALEIDSAEISEAALAAGEDLANRIVKENRPVILHEVTPEEARKFPLRKAPPGGERIRVVEVDSFDWSACGGVHVASTGEVFLVMILGTEKIRGRLRVRSVMGKRALDDYRRKTALAQGLSRLLTCSEAEVRDRVEELAAREREQGRELRRLRVERAVASAEEALADARRIGRRFYVSRVFEGYGPEALKAFSDRIIAETGRMAAAADRTAGGFQWTVAHSFGEGFDLPGFLAPILAAFDVRGGGRGTRMQGSGKEAVRAEEFLRRIGEELATRTA